MDDLGITDETVKVKLGNQEYILDFTMASIYFLADKYGDVVALFSSIGKGIDTKSLDIICDLIYAGILECDDDDKLKAPISSKQIMNKIHFKDIPVITDAIKKAFASAFPEAKKNPTPAVKAAKAKSGTGDTSTQPEQLS